MDKGYRCYEVTPSVSSYGYPVSKATINISLLEEETWTAEENMDDPLLCFGTRQSPEVLISSNQFRLDDLLLAASEVMQYIDLKSTLEPFARYRNISEDDFHHLHYQIASYCLEATTRVSEHQGSKKLVIEIFLGMVTTYVCTEEEYIQNYRGLVEQSQMEDYADFESNKLVPASVSSLELLKTRKFGVQDSDKNPCSVCLIDFPVGDAVVETPCFHLFHWDCIEPWFKKTNTCPLCRMCLKR